MGDTQPLYDVVVVGAGLMGSSAAYYASLHLQQQQQQPPPRVLLLEQFELLHGKGSSHGDSRIFRIAYANPTYAKMCIDSFQMWHELEAISGEPLLTMTGELDFADEKSKLTGIIDVLEQFAKPFEDLTGDQVNARFPGFSLPSQSHAVFNPCAAVLNPTRAMSVLQSLAVGHGAEIRANSRVTSVRHTDQEDARMEVVLQDGTSLYTKRCIITAGPWTQKFLEEMTPPSAISIRPVATFGTFWKVTNHSAWYEPSQFPVFIDYGGSGAYGLPQQDPQVGVKVCSHNGPDVDPQTRHEITTLRGHDLAQLQQFISTHLPHVDATALSQVDLCMYSMTKDENFILDFVDLPGGQGQVVVGAGFSGHGAKMTPVIGKILVDLALVGETEYPIEMFAASRLEKLK